jgi:hypothetical protein
MNEKHRWPAALVQIGEAMPSGEYVLVSQLTVVHEPLSRDYGMTVPHHVKKDTVSLSLHVRLPQLRDFRTLRWVMDGCEAF